MLCNKRVKWIIFLFELGTYPIRGKTNRLTTFMFPNEVKKGGPDN